MGRDWLDVTEGTAAPSAYLASLCHATLQLSLSTSLLLALHCSFKAMPLHALFSLRRTSFPYDLGQVP